MKNLEIKPRPITVKLVFNQNGKSFTTSHVISSVFEKEHKNILSAIRNLECDSTFIKLNFKLCHKINELRNNRKEPYYEITRDGCVFLIMGFTGEKASKWKIKFIEAFNLMEAELLKQNSQPYMPRGYPQMLEAARNDWKQVRKELIQAISDFFSVRTCFFSYCVLY